jgi:hypothetical protein
MFYALLAPLSLAFLISRLKNRLDDTDYKVKFGTLTDRLSTKKQVKLYAHVVLIFKLLFTVAVLVLMREFPGV